MVVFHGGVDGGKQGGAALVPGQGEGEKEAEGHSFIHVRIYLKCHRLSANLRKEEKTNYQS